MEILGIGPLEFVLIFILALVLLGPKDMVSSARKFAQWIRKITQSDFWQDAVDTSREIRQFPTKIMKEAGLDEELRKINRDLSASNEQRIWEKDMEKSRSMASKDTEPKPGTDPDSNPPAAS
jgi:Sec-independent protein translocase protein TatA